MSASRPFEAKYRGPCAADCGRGIQPGDLAVFVDDETMHEDCAAKEAAAERQIRRTPTCGRCGMVHAGECW